MKVFHRMPGVRGPSFDWTQPPNPTWDKEVVFLSSLYALLGETAALLFVKDLPYWKLLQKSRSRVRPGLAIPLPDSGDFESFISDFWNYLLDPRVHVHIDPGWPLTNVMGQLRAEKQGDVWTVWHHCQRWNEGFELTRDIAQFSFVDSAIKPDNPMFSPDGRTLMNSTWNLTIGTS